MQYHSNVDQQEIDKFAALADRWWDRDGEFKPLHDINPLRLAFIQQYCELAGKKILDVGCGGGILTESLAQCGGIVTGIDMAENVLAAARLHQSQHHQQLPIDYHLTTAEAFAEQHPGQYDIVTCMELLEHVPDPAAVVKACAALIKPNGAVFFSTLNRTPKAYLFAVVGAEYVLRLLPKGTHHYDKFIRPSELTHWSHASDLTLNCLKGLSYNILTKQYHLSDDLNVNYLAYYQKSVE